MLKKAWNWIVGILAVAGSVLLFIKLRPTDIENDPNEDTKREIEADIARLDEAIEENKTVEEKTLDEELAYWEKENEESN